MSEKMEGSAGRNVSLSAQRRRLLLSCGASLLLPVVFPGMAWASEIVAVRIWPASEYTRVTLEHLSGLKFSHFVVAAPDRLVVDIEGADLNPILKELASKVIPNDPYIASIRVAQHKPRVIRLVFDLKLPVNPQLFQLEPVADYKNRLVLDLLPTTPVADPITAFLDERGAQGHPALRDFGRPDSPTASTGAAEKRTADPAPNAPAASTAHAPPRDAGRPIVIVLDPGHGGEDPGAIGASGAQEKKVVLDIARRLKARIDATPGMRAVLTRDGDYFVPLNTRVEKARRARADLMVSIHADAFIKPEARGSSVFALSEKGASSAAARWLADNENAADLVGGVNVRTQDAQLARVLFDLSTTAQISDSLKVGKAVLNEIGNLNRLHKNHVEQAGFAVLKAPDIPSILIETAFISNPEEERRLLDDQYQEQMAKAIVTGIQRYFQRAGSGLRTTQSG